MQTSSLLTICLIYILLSFINSLLLPIHLSKASKMCENSKFKTPILCVYDAYNIYVTLKFGPRTNTQLRHTINMQLDTGSYSTWLVTNNTMLFDMKGNERNWQDVFDSTLVSELDYSPDKNDRANIPLFLQHYGDRLAAVISYNNYQLELDQVDGRNLEIPMHLLFAVQLYTNLRNAPFIGLLGLGLVSNKEDPENLFLYKFLDGRSDSFKPMMSFDINYTPLNPGVSCFGLGEPVRDKSRLTGPIIHLNTASGNSAYWDAEIELIQLEFLNGNKIIMKSGTPYSMTGQTMHINTEDKPRIIAVVDTGFTGFGISNDFVQQMTANDQQLFKSPYTFDCDKSNEVLPEITIGFVKGAVNLTIPKEKLYFKPDVECTGFLYQFNITNVHFMLGTAFFGSVYVEMSWKDTRGMKPSDLIAPIDFEKKLTFVQK